MFARALKNSKYIIIIILIVLIETKLTHLDTGNIDDVYIKSSMISLLRSNSEDLGLSPIGGFIKNRYGAKLHRPCEDIFDRLLTPSKLLSMAFHQRNQIKLAFLLVNLIF
jgi:hypothetical protein